MAPRGLRDFIAETIAPVAGGEKKFWDAHSVVVKKHDEPERDEKLFTGSNVKEAPFKGKGEDGWLKTGVNKTERDERDVAEEGLDEDAHEKDVDYINSHREALGYRKIPHSTHPDKVREHLRKIRKYAPHGNDPWGRHGNDYGSRK